MACIHAFKSTRLEVVGTESVRTLHFHSRDPGLIPGQGTKILQDELCGTKKKKKNYLRIKCREHQTASIGGMTGICFEVLLSGYSS